MRRAILSAALCVLVAIVVSEVDLLALRICYYDLSSYLTPHAVIESITQHEPSGCIRLEGPVGAEDGVLLADGPPVILLSELDAAACRGSSR